MSAVYVWGFGKLGQLGNGKKSGSLTPVELKLVKGDRPVQIATGGLFTAVVTQKGNVYVCGCGKYGRLGLGHDNDVDKPARVVPAKDARVSQIAAGSWHTCAISYLGRLFAWGYNSKHNVLGRSGDKDENLEDNGKTLNGLKPAIVPSLSGIGVKKVSCGHNFTLALSKEGRVYSWGCGRYGVLGHGDETCVLQPRIITAVERVAMATICAGYTHCGMVACDGRLYMCGKGCDGALGFGAEDLANKTEPTWLQSLNPVCITEISCSVGEHRGHTLALSQQGTVYAWGDNYKGKLGLGDSNPRYSPVEICIKYFDECKVINISAGGNHSGAITAEGHIFTWGSGKDGRLGHVDMDANHVSYYSPKPKRVTTGLPGNKRAVQISCSHYHTVALLEQ